MDNKYKNLVKNLLIKLRKKKPQTVKEIFIVDCNLINCGLDNNSTYYYYSGKKF